MCDYSLMQVQNRLANEGEALVTHRFHSGAIGLASAKDLVAFADWQAKQNVALRRGVVAAIQRAIIGNTSTDAPVVCAICVPPGAELTLVNIPQSIQRSQGVGSTERVTFDQLDVRVNNYRDAFRFRNKKAVLIQHFGEGVKATVLSMENAKEREETREEVFVR